MRCPECDKTYDEDAEFCPQDGARLLADSMTDPFIGRVLDGRYRVTERVGHGGMGTVYRAVQVNVQRDVAVKVLRADAAADERPRRYFEAEARIISRLAHPHTLRLIDFGVSGEGQLYIVTEFLEGRSLEQVIEQDGRVEPEQMLAILRDVADALTEAHGFDVVHRDLKPGNIFLQQVGDREVVKVLDFGVARYSGRSFQTTTGSVLGSPGYMAPEQAAAEAITPATDLYSLGVTAFHCLTGRPPFVGDNPYVVMLQHVHERVPAFADFGVSVPGPVEALVRRLMAKEPAERPESAAALRDEVVALSRALESGEMSDAPLEEPAPRGPAWPLWAGAVALVALGAAGWLALRPPAEVPPPAPAATVVPDAAPAVVTHAPVDASRPAPDAAPPPPDAAKKPTPVARKPVIRRPPRPRPSAKKADAGRPKVPPGFHRVTKPKKP